VPATSAPIQRGFSQVRKILLPEIKGANYCPRSWKTLFFLRTLFSLSKSEHEDTISQNT